MNRNPGASPREERIVKRRDDDEIVRLKRRIARLENDLVVVLVYYSTGEFMDALTGATRVPRVGEYINLPEWEGEDERDFDKVEVASVTWALVNTHGWQPVLHVVPLYNTGAPELLNEPRIPKDL